MQVIKLIDSKEKVLIVDVRTPQEHREGHLKNSVLLPLDTIEAKASEVLPDKNQTLYIYCRTGRRSAQAVVKLQKLGYTDIHSMDGGILAWENSGYPIVR